MKPFFQADSGELYQGHVLDVLRTLPDESVQCCVTSPPYWGLRDYGVEGQIGLEKTPEEYVSKLVEVFREVRRVLRGDGTLWLNLGDCYATGAGKVGGCPGGGTQGERFKEYGPFGGHRGSRDGSPKHTGRSQVPDQKNPYSRIPTYQPNRMPLEGLKPKDLVGIPWMVAFALRADGWYLRQDVIWNKPNPMPESVTDRCTKAHEYIFLMSKGQRYFYDGEAVKEPALYESEKRYERGRSDSHKWADGGPGNQSIAKSFQHMRKDKQRGHGRRHAGFNDRWDKMAKTDQCSGYRNKRTVWTVATQSFPEAHFATFPPKLITPCILAGSPQGGTVLDPFMGSGTTALVAHRLYRRWVGIELSEEYCRMAAKRIDAEARQGRLFNAIP